MQHDWRGAMKRMSDEEFLAEIDALDKTERYALAMQRSTREAMRARAREAQLEAALVKAGAAAIQTGAAKVAHIIADALEDE
jgi:hypothetical protein